MPLKQQIQDDLKTAMLGGDRLVTEVLRGLKSTILYEEVAQNKRETGLSDEEVEKLLARESKKRTESAALFKQGGNLASSEKELAEKEIIARYLPKQMDEAELRSVVEQVVSELGVSGPQAMGQVIGAVRAKVGSRADGALIAKVVKEIIQ